MKWGDVIKNEYGELTKQQLIERVGEILDLYKETVEEMERVIKLLESREGKDGILKRLIKLLKARIYGED